MQNLDRLVTQAMIAENLQRLGVAAGQTIMLHASVKAIGWIVGGPEVILRTILDILTPTGTLMMYVGWDEKDIVCSLANYPESIQRIYRESCPAFDPMTSRASWRDMGILTEYLRTLPGAFRSRHPESSVAAIGAKAEWLTNDHPMLNSYGPGSPLAKFVEADGKVLILGSPLARVTVLHYAETLTSIPNKKVLRYQMPILVNGQRVWQEFEDYDTGSGIVDGKGEYFGDIVRDFLADKKVEPKAVGYASSYLLPAAELVRFGISWMERNLLPKSL